MINIDDNLVDEVEVNGSITMMTHGVRDMDKRATRHHDNVHTRRCRPTAGLNRVVGQTGTGRPDELEFMFVE